MVSAKMRVIGLSLYAFIPPDDHWRPLKGTDAITAGLSSVCGTERKLRTLRIEDDTEPSAPAPTYPFVD